MYYEQLHCLYLSVCNVRNQLQWSDVICEQYDTERDLLAIAKFVVWVDHRVHYNYSLFKYSNNVEQSIFTSVGRKRCTMCQQVDSSLLASRFQCPALSNRLNLSRRWRTTLGTDPETKLQILLNTVVVETGTKGYKKSFCLIFSNWLKPLPCNISANGEST